MIRSRIALTVRSSPCLIEGDVEAFLQVVGVSEFVGFDKKPQKTLVNFDIGLGLFLQSLKQRRHVVRPWNSGTEVEMHSNFSIAVFANAAP
jgi:hypothetical protein